MITPEHIDYLSKADKILKNIIENNTIPKISKSDDYVLDLYKYIIFQQISIFLHRFHSVHSTLNVRCCTMDHDHDRSL